MRAIKSFYIFSVSNILQSVSSGAAVKSVDTRAQASLGKKKNAAGKADESESESRHRWAKKKNAVGKAGEREVAGRRAE